MKLETERGRAECRLRDHRRISKSYLTDKRWRKLDNFTVDGLACDSIKCCCQSFFTNIRRKPVFCRNKFEELHFTSQKE